MPKAEFSNSPELFRVKGLTDVVKVGNVAYVSGMTPVDADGNTVGVGDPQAQVRQVWHNIECALKTVGGSLRNVVSVKNYLISRDHYWASNKVREELFPDNPPASTRFIVVALGRDDWLVEIQATAHLDI